MGDCDTVNVLVLMPSPRTRFAIRNLPQDVSNKYRFIFHDPKPETPAYFSLQDYLDDAKETVRHENVQVVLFGTSDTGALLKAALVEEFSYLQGPSVESVFLGYNKYYTRCFLDSQPVPFASIDLTAANLDQACEDALQKVGTPAFFKPTSCSGSRGISSITNIQQLKEFAQSYVSSDVFTIEDVDAKFMNPFYAKNIDMQKYPFASKPTAILEKHMGKAAQINADGYVFDGKIFHWSISDNLFSQSMPLYSFGAINPTTLLESTQKNIWNVFDAVVGKMIDFGYNNEFVNLEVFLLDSGEVKLLEVNPRRGGNLLASGEVFIDGNVTAAQLKLAQGENPGPPVQNGRHVLHSYIRTCGSGKAKDFYDYSYTDPGLIPDRDPDDIVDGSGESGTVLCRTCLSGGSHEEVMEKYLSTCKRVLLNPELSVWD